MLIFMLTFIGGVVVRLGAGSPSRDPERYALVLGASNMLLGTVGFVISGFLSQYRRWRHITFVAAGTWALSIYSVLFFGTTVRDYFLAIMPIAVMATVGGSLSLIFRRHQRFANAVPSAEDQQ